MKKVNGVLEMLGKSVVSGGATSYSVVEIGDQALPNIWVPNGLANFLEKGLGSPVDVWLDDRKLLAVRLENGKTYIGKHPYASWGVVVAFIFFGLITLPIFFGLVFLYQAAKIYGDLKRQNAIIQELPDAIQV